MKRVLLITDIPGVAENFNKLQKGFETYVEIPEGEKVSDFEIIVHDPPKFTNEMGRIIFSEESKRVKWIHSTFAGVDGLISKVQSGDFDSYRPVLTKTGFYLRYPMFEFVLQHILNEENNYQAVLEMNTKNEGWEETQMRIVKKFRPKERLKIGIMGYGNIGKYIADSLVRCFGVKDITIFKKSNPAPSETEKNYKFFSTVSEFFTSNEYDYVISVLPSTPETNYMLNYDIIARNIRKKDHTVFINIGRGSLIRTEHIIELVEKGVLRKCVLDVTEEEPLPKDSKLWNYFPEKIVLTPHSAGWSSPEQTVLEFLRLYEKYVEGKELDYLVNWGQGY